MFLFGKDETFFSFLFAHLGMIYLQARDSQMGRGRARTGGSTGGGSTGMNGAPYGRSPGGGSSTSGGWGEYGPGMGGGRSGPSMGGGMARNGQEKVEYQFLVPSTKTGIIIGKGNFANTFLYFVCLKSFFVRLTGGETIKQINQQSGAFCELDRRPPPNPNEKIFIIRGSHEQVELAKRMISEKLGLVSSSFLILKNVFFFFCTGLLRRL